MEQFVICFPQHADIKDDDGNTPLHVASAFGHRDIVTLLADLVQFASRNLCIYRNTHVVYVPVGFHMEVKVHSRS